MSRSTVHGAMAAVLATVLLVLTGCATIPTDGPIGSGEVVVSEEDSITLFANDPIPDAGPEEIIGGFLRAVDAGIYDEYQAARNHLTAFASRQWDPRARVVVYRGLPEITEQDDGSYQVSLDVQATLDQVGRTVSVDPGIDEVLTFAVTRGNNNQWRITTPPVGALVTAPTFEQAYRSTPVYFATTDRTHLVPDVRWFPARFQATAAVEALLAGPSPWLRDAVTSGAPEGARLSTTAVAVTGGVAQVGLSSQARLADAQDRALLRSQLEATLTRLSGVVVDRVQVSVGGVETDLAEPMDLVRDPGPAGGPYLLTEDGLAVLEAGQIEMLQEVPENTAALAVGTGGRTVVLLEGDSRLVLLPEDGSPPVPLLEGTGLIRPASDRHGWYWTARADPETGAFTAVRADGAVVEVEAEWLAGRTVRAVEPARDGARVAVVSEGAGGARSVDIAAVVRDEDGAPRLLGDSVPLGTALVRPEDVGWLDETTLAVLIRPDGLGQVEFVPMAGPTVATRPVEGAAAVAAGRSERALYLVTDEGRLYVRQTRGWSGVAEGIRAAAFPG